MKTTDVPKNECVFDLEAIWDDRVRLVIYPGDPNVTAEHEGWILDTSQGILPLTVEQIDVGKIVFKDVEIDFTGTIVENLVVFNERLALVCGNKREDLGETLFPNGLEGVNDSIRRRKGLKFGRDFQLVAAWQAFLRGQNEGQIAAQAFSFCSICYRYTEQPERIGGETFDKLTEILKIFANNLNCEIAEEARWFPSVHLAYSQLALMLGKLEIAEVGLNKITDNVGIIAVEPICSYNIALANCLLSYLYWVAENPSFRKVAEQWLDIFYLSVNHIDIRFGTVYEFGAIYKALFLNYKFILLEDEHDDRRLRSLEFKDIMETCMRIRLDSGTLARLKMVLTPLMHGKDLKKFGIGSVTQTLVEKDVPEEISNRINEEFKSRPLYQVRRSSCPCCKSTNRSIFEYPSRADLYTLNFSVEGCHDCGFSKVAVRPYGYADFLSGKYLKGSNIPFSALNGLICAAANIAAGEDAVSAEVSRLGSCEKGEILYLGNPLIPLITNNFVLTDWNEWSPFKSSVEEEQDPDTNVITPVITPRDKNRRYKKIILNHCLEYIPSDELPKLLRQAKDLLEEGGTLYVEVRNASLLRLNARKMSLSPAVSFFSPEALFRVLSLAGFDHVRISSFGPAHSLRRLIGHKPDAQFDLCNESIVAIAAFEPQH
ncbi:methyltransferase domain-containing protein [Labrenzia sp. VG12]|uniref:methyltransferase domain-containing protein n=1 Tax=Labrenzia sp. VG12 TaxID=2021862 RepID=UPI0012FD721C|nr:methyltransferase domain-containing protein [Labrenzia sp. VG12]